MSESDALGAMRQAQREEHAIARAAPDAATFNTWLVQIQPKLRAYARSLTRNYDLADELTQNICLRALSRREQFRKAEGQDDLTRWMFSIMRNYFIIDQQREARRNRTVFEIPHASPADQETAAYFADLRQSVRELSPEEREAFEKVVEEGDSLDEAARKLAIPLKTLRARLHKAQSFLAAAQGLEKRPSAVYSDQETLFDLSREELESFMSTLPKTRSDTFRLRAIEKLSEEETAKRLGIPIGTVKSNFNRARTKLAAYVGQGRQNMSEAFFLRQYKREPEAFKSFLMTLSRKRRDAVEKLTEGKSYEDGAQELGIKVKTFNDRIKAAREQWKKYAAS